MAAPRVQALHPELLPVLVNALGEGGAFEADGSPVPAWKATYVVSMLVPETLFDVVCASALLSELHWMTVLPADGLYQSACF